jgi:hypothetical protein
LSSHAVNDVVVNPDPHPPGQIIARAVGELQWSGGRLRHVLDVVRHCSLTRSGPRSFHHTGGVPNPNDVVVDCVIQGGDDSDEEASADDDSDEETAGKGKKTKAMPLKKRMAMEDEDSENEEDAALRAELGYVISMLSPFDCRQTALHAVDGLYLFHGGLCRCFPSP